MCINCRFLTWSGRIGTNKDVVVVDWYWIVRGLLKYRNILWNVIILRLIIIFNVICEIRNKKKDYLLVYWYCICLNIGIDIMRFFLENNKWVVFFNVWLIMLLQRLEILHRWFYSRQFYLHMRMHVWLHHFEPSYEIHVRWYAMHHAEDLLLPIFSTICIICVFWDLNLRPLGVEALMNP